MTTTETKSTAIEIPDAPAGGQLRNINSRINISAEQVKLATQNLPEEQRQAIRWFYHLARAENWTLQETAERIGYSDSTTPYRVFQGTYSANLTRVVAAIVKFRALWEKRAASKRPDFVETRLAKRIWQVCDFALISQSIAMIFGDSQVGKTAALEEYQRRNNHGQTVYMRMPSGAGIQLVARELARAAGVSPKASFEALRTRLINAFDDTNTILVDEMHLAFITYQKGSALKVLEFLRELHDRCGCGMVLCGTNVWRDELQEGQYKNLLKQLRRRGVAELQLETRPTAEDLDKFGTFYGLGKPAGPAATLRHDLICEFGLGRYLKYLAAANRIATRRAEPMTWDHLQEAHQILLNLSSPK